MEDILVKVENVWLYDLMNYVIKIFKKLQQYVKTEENKNYFSYYIIIIITLGLLKNYTHDHLLHLHI